jgi:hypothetical protein
MSLRLGRGPQEKAGFAPVVVFLPQKDGFIFVAHFIGESQLMVFIGDDIVQKIVCILPG